MSNTLPSTFDLFGLLSKEVADGKAEVTNQGII